MKIKKKNCNEKKYWTKYHLKEAIIWELNSSYIIRNSYKKKEYKNKKMKIKSLKSF